MQGRDRDYLSAAGRKKAATSPKYVELFLCGRNGSLIRVEYVVAWNQRLQHLCRWGPR